MTDKKIPFLKLLEDIRRIVEQFVLGVHKLRTNSSLLSEQHIIGFSKTGLRCYSRHRAYVPSSE